MQSADLFLSTLLAKGTDAIVRILIKQAAALRNPPLTVDQVLDHIAIGAPSFTREVRLLIHRENDARGRTK